MIRCEFVLLAIALGANCLSAQNTQPRGPTRPVVAADSAALFDVALNEIDRRLRLTATERPKVAEALRNDQARRQATRASLARTESSIAGILRGPSASTDSGLASKVDSLLTLCAAAIENDRAFFQSIRFLGHRRSARLVLLVSSLQGWLLAPGPGIRDVP